MDSSDFGDLLAIPHAERWVRERRSRPRRLFSFLANGALSALAAFVAQSQVQSDW